MNTFQKCQLTFTNRKFWLNKIVMLHVVLVVCKTCQQPRKYQIPTMMRSA